MRFVDLEFIFARSCAFISCHGEARTTTGDLKLSGTDDFCNFAGPCSSLTPSGSAHGLPAPRRPGGDRQHNFLYQKLTPSDAQMGAPWPLGERMPQAPGTTPEREVRASRRRKPMCTKLRTVVLFFLAGCSMACPEPFGREHVLLFVTPLDSLIDGGQMEITIPQHYGGGDRVHSCARWDFDFNNTQIEATGQGSLTVVAERIPTSDPSWKAGGYRLVAECHLPAGASEASDMISVRVVRDSQTLYADEWVQPCKRQ